MPGANDPANPFPTPAKLTTIDDDFGGWSAASKKFFDPDNGHHHQDPAGDRQVVTTATTTVPGRAARRRRPAGVTRLTLPSRVGLGVALTWFSALALIPLIAILVETSEGGWAAFWDTLTNPQTAAALRLTITQALLVTLVNVVMGTLIAWVLVRDRFVGKRALEVIIDIPFALPTIVAGLVLLSLYGPTSPIGRQHRRTPGRPSSWRSCS